VFNRLFWQKAIIWPKSAYSGACRSCLSHAVLPLWDYIIPIYKNAKASEEQKFTEKQDDIFRPRLLGLYKLTLYMKFRQFVKKIIACFVSGLVAL